MALNKTALNTASSDKETRLKQRRYTPAALLAALIALLMLTIYLATGGSNTAKTVTIAPGASPAVTITETAQASGIGIFGGAQNLGHGMNRPNAWENSFSTIPLDNKQGRIFTLKEAVGGNLKFTNYEGEGEGEEGVVAADPERMEGAPKTISKDSEKLTKLRSVGTILVGGALNGIADTLNGVTGLTYDLTQNFVTAAFNPHTVCSDPNDKDCVFNVTKLVSGDGKTNKGIIGNVTDSVYAPFAGAAALIIIGVGVYIYGHKHKNFMRASLNGLYVVLAGVLGFAILSNAGLFTSMPVKVMQEVGGAAMGITTAAGDEETGATKDGNTSTASAICKSKADNLSNSEKTVLNINSMTCTIWRVVRLDPFARAQFGRPFAQLDVKDPEMAEIIKKAEVDPNTFCVPLKVMGTPADYRNKTLKLEESNHKVCNVAAYQLYLQADAQLGDKANERKHGVDPRWYNIVAVAHADDRLWDNWSYSWTSASNRFMVTTIAMLSFVPIAIVMLLFSIASLIQLFTVVIMMILLPFIMIALMDKNRGMQIAKRYGSFMVGAVLSFILYSTILAVGVIILSAIIDSVADLALVMVFNIIVAAALWKQRRQLISLVENANPMSNNYMGSKIGNVLDRQNAAGTLRSGMVGAISGANLRSAWRNRNNENAEGEKPGFLRAVSKNMREAGKVAAEQNILSRKPNSMAATSIRTRQKLEADKMQELQHYNAAKQSEMETVRSDRQLAHNTVAYGQNATTAQANIEQTAVADANNAANVMRRTNENIQRLVLEFATGGDGSDRFQRETFADIFRAEQAMQAASHKRKLANIVGDEYAAMQASAEYNQARSLKGLYEESLTLQERSAYGNELNRMFQVDPLLAKSKSAIEDEFAQARQRDLQATEAGMQTYQATSNANKSLSGLLDKEHQEKAMHYATEARKRAENSEIVKKMSAEEATTFLNKTHDAALKEYLENNAPEQREGLALKMPELNRLEMPVHTLSTPEEHKQRLLDEQERLRQEKERQEKEAQERARQEQERKEREAKRQREQQENQDWDKEFENLLNNSGNTLKPPAQTTNEGNTSQSSNNPNKEEKSPVTVPLKTNPNNNLNTKNLNGGNTQKTEETPLTTPQSKPTPLNNPTKGGNTLNQNQAHANKEEVTATQPVQTPKPVVAPTPNAKVEATPKSVTEPEKSKAKVESQPSEKVTETPKATVEPKPEPKPAPKKQETPVAGKPASAPLPKPEPPLKKDKPPVGNNSPQSAPKPAEPVKKETPQPKPAPVPKPEPAQKKQETVNVPQQPKPEPKPAPQKQEAPQPQAKPEKPKVEAPKPASPKAETAPIPTVTPAASATNAAPQPRNPLKPKAEPAGQPKKKFFRAAPQPIRPQQDNVLNTPKYEAPTRRVDDSQ